MTPATLKLLPAAIAAATATFALGAQAYQPANLQAGPVFITPTVDTEVGYTDNLFRSEDDEKSTWKSVVTPKIQAWLQNGINTYSLEWEGTDYRYFSSHDDDFFDNRVNLDIHHEFNVRNRLNLFAEWWDTHEERGTGLAESVSTLIDEPVELERTTLGGSYTFGADSATGRLKLAAKNEDFEYQNFRAFTQYRDYDRDTLAGTFYWGISPRTDLLAEVRYQDVEYDTVNPLDPFGSLDAEEFNYFVGAEWEATAKTSGSIRLGMFDREYDSGLREDDDGFSWEIDLTYEPRSYSSWTLTSGRETRETNGLGDAVDSSNTELRWNHDWASRSSTHIAVNFGTDDYTGSEREDDLWGVDASYNYAWKRWLDLGIGYRYEDRDSEIDLRDYSRNEYYLQANFSL